MRRLRHLWTVCGASITLVLNFKCKDLGLQKPSNVVFINKSGKNSSRHMYGSVRWYSMRSHHVKWLPDTFKSARACYFEFHALLFKDSLFRDLILILIQGQASFPYFFLALSMLFINPRAYGSLLSILLISHELFFSSSVHWSAYLRWHDNSRVSWQLHMDETSAERISVNSKILNKTKYLWFKFTRRLSAFKLKSIKLHKICFLIHGLC